MGCSSECGGSPLASSMAVMPRDQMSACNSKTQLVTHSEGRQFKETYFLGGKNKSQCASEVLNKILILN